MMPAEREDVRFRQWLSTSRRRSTGGCTSRPVTRRADAEGLERHWSS